MDDEDFFARVSFLEHVHSVFTASSARHFSLHTVEEIDSANSSLTNAIENVNPVAPTNPVVDVTVQGDKAKPPTSSLSSLSTCVKPFTDLLVKTLEKAYVGLVPEILSRQLKVEEKHLRVRITAVKTVLNLHTKLALADFPFIDYFEQGALVQLNANISNISR